MKNIIRLITLFLMVVTLHASDSWGTDYKAALEKASKENKSVLLDFTGSDWCPWCKKLQKDVFSQDAFKEYAKKKLVLVEVDFPRGKEQSEELKAQNQALQAQYHVQGYPTLILLDPQGKILKQYTGSFDAPSAFISWVEGEKEKAEKEKGEKEKAEK